MAEMIALQVNAEAFKALLGQEQMTDREFTLFVRFVTGHEYEPSFFTKPLSDFTEEQTLSLLKTIEGIEKFKSIMNDGTELQREEIAQLNELYTFLSYFKKLTDQEQWSDADYIVWVRKETGTDSDDTVDPVDPVDPVEPRDPVTVDLDDLSSKEMNSLLYTISRIEDFQGMIEN